MNSPISHTQQSHSLESRRSDERIEKLATDFGYRQTAVSYSRAYDSLIRTFTHTESGATVISIANADPYRALALTFRTHPSDSSGIFHLTEHLVLCGSKEYSNRDTFRDMAARSFGAKPNAFTASHSTFFPVASFNECDFLMQAKVYFEAAFNPLLREEDFLIQRGHIKTGQDGSKVFDGVVYNEMKDRAFGKNAQIDRELSRLLWKGTPGEHFAGGDPAELRLIEYQKVLEAHQRHYHPANGALIFYGDLPLEKQFALASPYVGNARGPEGIVLPRTRDLVHSVGDRRGECTFVPEESSIDPQSRVYTRRFVLPEQAGHRPEIIDCLAGLIGTPDSFVNQQIREKGLSNGMWYSRKAPSVQCRRLPFVPIRFRSIELKR